MKGLLDELRAHPDFPKLLKYLIYTLSIWILAVCVIVSASAMSKDFSERLTDADTVITTARRIKSLPESLITGKEPISEISGIVDSLGIKDKMSKLGASPSGLVFEISGLDTGTFSKLVSTIADKGLKVKNCEARVFSTEKTPASITASFVIGVELNEDTGNS